MKTIDAEPMEPVENQERALAVRQPSLLPETMQKTAVSTLTPQQARVSEVTDALAPAYAKASTLEMTDAEIEAVMAPFPDSFVSIRPHDGLIYIPHIHISDRLNQVFKPGRWALVCRRHWLEGNVMYGEYVLLIRGCYVGESVGGHPYVANNPKMNYSDALESTAGEALRRIAGKRLSCGSQVWNPDYACAWVSANAYQQGGKWYKRTGKPTPTQAPPPSPAPSTPSPAPTAAPTAPKVATAATRDWLIKQFAESTELLHEYFVQCGKLLPNEALTDLPLGCVPTTKAELDLIKAAVETFSKTGQAEVGFKPHADAPLTEPAADEAWKAFVVPFGKSAGKTLGDLDTKTIFGFWANYKVETEYNGKPKKAETIAKDQAFRAALDAAGTHYKFTKPEDQQ